MKRSFILSIGYLIFGILWIFLTDAFVFYLYKSDIKSIELIQNYKGYIFVFLSSLILFFISNTLYKNITQRDDEIKRLLSNKHIGLIKFLKNGTITDISKSTQLLLGYTKQQLQGKNLSKLIDNSHLSSFLNAFSSKNYFDLECKIKKKSNESFWVRFEGSLAQSDLERTEYIAVFFSIDKRKRAEGELRNSLKDVETKNEFISTILDNLPIGISVNRISTGKVTYMNRTFSSTYGWPMDAFTDVDSFFVNVYPDSTYRTEIMSQVFADLESKDSSRMRWSNVQITTQSGEKKYINAQNIPLYSQDLMISIVQDQTPLVHAKQEKDGLFANTSDLISLLDSKGKILQVNPAWKSFFGETYNASVSPNFTNFINPKDIDRFKEMKDKLTPKNSSEELSLSLNDKNGKKSYFLWNFIFLSQTKLIYAIGRDISDNVTYLKSIEYQNKRLKDIAWIQSHEVRAPLTKVLGLIDLISNNFVSKEESVQIISHIIESANELDMMIRKIVELSEKYDLTEE